MGSVTRSNNFKNNMDLQTIAKHNARTFILYRILFRARFYYPVFTLLFLDFGLSLSQFAILNSIWALTIVLFEIPLGGLADTIGRRKIVILSAILLNIELLVWLLLLFMEVIPYLFSF